MTTSTTTTTSTTNLPPSASASTFASSPVDMLTVPLEQSSSSASKKRRVTDHLSEFLNDTKCNSYLFPRWSPPMILTIKDTIEIAFQTLVSFGILAVPIVDRKNNFVSVVSMIDLLNIITDNITTSEYVGNKILQAKPIQQKFLSELTFKDPLCTVRPSDPVVKAVELMIEKKAHRVVVVDDTGKFVNFITQSRVLQVINKELQQYVPAVHKSLLDLKLQGIVLKDVEYVSHRDTALTAFKLMKEKHVSSVAIIDDRRRLVGCISVNDLKHVRVDMNWFDQLNCPVEFYMAKINNGCTDEVTDKESDLRNLLSSKLIRPVITCSLEDSLAGVISIIDHYNIHRVFVESEKGEPIGVLSLCDILEAILQLRTCEAC